MNNTPDEYLSGNTQPSLKAIQQPACTLRIRGLVQGVGFRPTVLRLADRLNLKGCVLNDTQGVLIHVSGQNASIDIFKQALQDECPPLARIDSIEQLPCTESFTDNKFRIIKSTDSKNNPSIDTGIIADAATCADCLQDLANPSDKRFQYPFLNCTHCGPRFSIIHRIPYDRANTSMAEFKLCAYCQNEYETPQNRRFHAQPVACECCGPVACLCDKSGNNIHPSSGQQTQIALINEAAKHLSQGAIVAIKGIGGFHLACDASNHEAIKRLRQRKHRPDKALALMAKNLEQIRAYCKVDALEEQALSSSAAPIVILDKLNTTALPTNIAPDQQQLGFMLPHSPLHHLLMAQLSQPIVLTSGNHSDAPQCIDNADARKCLGDIADIFLLHNRPIENRIDDSLVRKMGGKIRVLRRARGYAPGQLQLPAGFAQHPPLLAFGGELKSTFCLLKNGHAILSQHMGNLEEARTFADYRKNLSLYLKLYAHHPTLIATDKHPQYLSTQLGCQYAEKHKLNLIQVQHHHAHIAACMLDNQVDLDEEPLIGIAFDGLGFGDDASLWGGEFLLADYQNCKRLAHLKPVALPGGSQAIYEPWRNTWAQLSAAFSWETFSEKYGSLALTRKLKLKPLNTLQHMMTKNINSPLSSSAGRLFDAVAAAINLAPEKCSYEGQAAVRLENCIETTTFVAKKAYHLQLKKKLNSPQKCYELDPTPLWKSLADDLMTDTSAAIIAARFHYGLAQSVVDTAVLLAKENGTQRIALSGGVFQNRIFFNLLIKGLESHHLQVLTHSQIPANDGGLALGQAAIAAAKSIKGSHSLCV